MMKGIHKIKLCKELKYDAENLNLLPIMEIDRRYLLPKKKIIKKNILNIKIINYYIN